MPRVRRRSGSLAAQVHYCVPFRSAPGSKKRGNVEVYMKWRIAAGALVTLMWVLPAQAERLLEADIPFAFEAGQVRLPAGAYTVSFPASNVIAIQSVDRKHAVMTLTNSARSRDTQGQSKLIFNRYGDRYFLSRVWAAQYQDGRQLMPSKAESELARRTRPGTGTEVALGSVRR